MQKNNRIAIIAAAAKKNQQKRC